LDFTFLLVAAAVEGLPPSDRMITVGPVKKAMPIKNNARPVSMSFFKHTPAARQNPNAAIPHITPKNLSALLI
jgi:hypothetical protein